LEKEKKLDTWDALDKYYCSSPNSIDIKGKVQGIWMLEPKRKELDPNNQFDTSIGGSGDSNYRLCSNYYGKCKPKCEKKFCGDKIKKCQKFCKDKEDNYIKGMCTYDTSILTCEEGWEKKLNTIYI
jgi:hypothetical protein